MFSTVLLVTGEDCCSWNCGFCFWKTATGDASVDVPQQRRMIKSFGDGILYSVPVVGLQKGGCIDVTRGLELRVYVA